MRETFEFFFEILNLQRSHFSIFITKGSSLSFYDIGFVGVFECMCGVCVWCVVLFGVCGIRF